MLNLTSEKSKENFKNDIKFSSMKGKNKKLYIKISLNPNEKLNLKKINLTNKNLANYYNSGNKSTSRNSENDYLSRNQTTEKIISSRSFKHKGLLTETDKKKIKSIVNDFKMHKVVAERLLNKEKSFALNSVNNSTILLIL